MIDLIRMRPDFKALAYTGASGEALMAMIERTHWGCGCTVVGRRRAAAASALGTPNVSLGLAVPLRC